MHELLHIIEHTLVEALKLIPFLFLTYLAMEYLEHKTGEKAKHMVKKAGKWGPLIGGVAGAVPQCGFSAAASNLYAGRVITLGTLIAIFLSTSDEMLPILISAKMPMKTIGGILLAKIVIGTVAGFIIDFILRQKEEEHHHHHDHDHEEHSHIHELCEHEHCNCEKGIVRSAIKHTVQITFFIILITFALHLVLEFVGEDVLGKLILNQPILGPVLAGLVGLVPNCASSVVITQLYVENAMSLGAMMSGLLVGSGVGLLVLFRVNHEKKENLKILGLLYLIGVAAGIVIELIL
uniref:putative manganese transporter n=1 Tax=Acetatifactor sp. TaxID=1872090 RepID=UPI004057606E